MNKCECCLAQVAKPTDLTLIESAPGVAGSVSMLACSACLKKWNRRIGLEEYRARVKAGLVEKPKRRPETRRRVRCESNLVRSHELIVTVYPHGEIGLREPRNRTEYKVGLGDVWRFAVQIAICKLNGKVKAYKKTMGLREARRKARKELGL